MLPLSNNILDIAATHTPDDPEHNTIIMKQRHWAVKTTGTGRQQFAYVVTANITPKAEPVADRRLLQAQTVSAIAENAV